VDLRLGARVAGIDPAAYEVRLADGSRAGYAKLLLATGSSPRRLVIPGAEADGVLYLRRVGDSDAIKAAFETAARIAVIGDGWIGLETAAAARAAGLGVTILGRAELPLLRALGREAAQVFADLHRDQGVDLRSGVQVAEITGSGGRADGVRLADGSRVPAVVPRRASQERPAGENRGGRPAADAGGQRHPPSPRPASPRGRPRCAAYPKVGHDDLDIIPAGPGPGIDAAPGPSRHRPVRGDRRPGPAQAAARAVRPGRGRVDARQVPDHRLIPQGPER